MHCVNVKDIVLVMSGQFSHKIVLKSLSTKPQVENDHAGLRKSHKIKLSQTL